MADTPPTEPRDLTFEDALRELEQIVSELERGDGALEDSIAHFERGVALARRCEDRLNEADKKVALLLREGHQIVERDAETGEILAERPDPGVPVVPDPEPTPPPAPRAQAEPTPPASPQARPEPPHPADTTQQSLIPGLDDDDIPF